MDNAIVREAARKLFPGGVNSPVRSFRSVGGEPVPIARGEGAHVYDAEGRRYIDYIGAFGPLILGHAHAGVVAAIAAPARRRHGLRRADAGRSRTRAAGARQATGLERVRFVNSGTEATMTAIRLARAATGRDIVVKFDGGYHGHSDGLLVKAGSGVATLGLSDSAGVPAAIAGADGRPALQRRRPRCEAWFAEHADETAARHRRVGGRRTWGWSRPTPAFLEALSTVPQAHGALLIADEVITGFRLRYGLCGLLPGGGPRLPRQGHRRRAAGRRVRRPRRADGPARARRAGVPGGHAQREPAGDGRRRRDAATSSSTGASYDAARRARRATWRTA